MLIPFPPTAGTQSGICILFSPPINALIPRIMKFMGAFMNPIIASKMFLIASAAPWNIPLKNPATVLNIFLIPSHIPLKNFVIPDHTFFTALNAPVNMVLKKDPTAENAFDIPSHIPVKNPTAASHTVVMAFHAPSNRFLND